MNGLKLSSCMETIRILSAARSEIILETKSSAR
jgi:hypothetical protein